MTDCIRNITTCLYRLPLAEVLSDAMHGEHTHFELIITTVALDNGQTGTGYTYTGGIGGSAIKAMLDDYLAPFLLNKNVQNVEQLYQQMCWHIHYVGRGGLAMFAVSALDIALWDIRCRQQNRPLWQIIGGNENRSRVYMGGMDLNHPLPKLLADVQSYLKQGFNAVKIKVGRKTLADDVERVKAVREIIGSDCVLMVDANYGYSVEQAIQAADAFREYNIFWFEEPINPDDFAGYAKIARETDIPLAMGENLRTVYDFEQAFQHANLSFIQPDASNCGGISGWLRIAKLAKRYNIPVCSHGMQELHISLVCAQGSASWAEVHSFPIDRYTKRPLVITDHMAIAPSQPGIGVEFDWEKLEAEHDVAA